MIRAEAALRRPDGDPEPVHQARVAVRRLRSHLRAFAPLLERAWANGLSERLRWWGSALGAARDADVLLLRLPQLGAITTTLRERRDAAYARIAVDLDDPRYLSLLADVRAAAERPAFAACAQSAADAFVPEMLVRSWRPLRRAVRRRSRPPTDGELHRIRIRAKRVRYVAEAVVPVAGPAAEQFARHVEELQTVLGEQHDAVVAYRVLRKLGERDELTQAAMKLARAAADEGRRTWRDAWRDAQRTRFW